jgi:ribosomal protein S8
MTILSTSQGLMSGKEAQKKNLGGELVAKVW